MAWIRPPRATISGAASCVDLAHDHILVLSVHTYPTQSAIALRPCYFMPCVSQCTRSAARFLALSRNYFIDRGERIHVRDRQVLPRNLRLPYWPTLGPLPLSNSDRVLHIAQRTTACHFEMYRTDSARVIHTPTMSLIYELGPRDAILTVTKDRVSILMSQYS